MTAANCDVSSESGTGRLGFLPPSPRRRSVVQVISQPQDPWDLTANGLSSLQPSSLFTFTSLHPPISFFPPSPAVAVSWLWLTSPLSCLSIFSASVYRPNENEASSLAAFCSLFFFSYFSFKSQSVGRMEAHTMSVLKNMMQHVVSLID